MNSTPQQQQKRDVQQSRQVFRQTLEKIAQRQTIVQDHQSQKIVDARKPKDKALIDSELTRVAEYLERTGMIQAPDRKAIQAGLCLKDYIRVVNHLLSIMELAEIKYSVEQNKPKTDQNKVIGEGLNKIQDMLGYPEKSKLKPSDLPSISSTNAPKALMFLTWLVELTEFSSIMKNDICVLETQTEDQKKATKESFIGRLCNSSDPEQLFKGKEYMQTLNNLYSDFLQNTTVKQDKKEEQNQQYQNSNQYEQEETDKNKSEVTQLLFDIYKEDLQQQKSNIISKLKQEQMQLDKQYSRYQQQYHQSKQKCLNILNRYQFQLDPQDQSLNDIFDQQENENGGIQQLLRNTYDLFMNKADELIKEVDEQIKILDQDTREDLKSKLRQNSEIINELQKQKEKVEQEYQLQLLKTKDQGDSYNAYMQAELTNKNLTNENIRCEAQINKLSQEQEKAQQTQIELQKSITDILTQLNKLQITTEDIDTSQKIIQKQTEYRTQLSNYDTQQRSLQFTLDDKQSQQQVLEGQYYEVETQLQDQKKSVDNLKNQLTQRNNDYNQNMSYYQKQTDILQQEIQQQQQRNIQIQNNIQERKQNINVLIVERDQQQKRIQGEQQKLTDVVAQIYQIIADSRKDCRGNLEMLRHNLVKAKEQLQNWKQQNPL